MKKRPTYTNTYDVGRKKYIFLYSWSFLRLFFKSWDTLLDQGKLVNDSVFFSLSILTVSIFSFVCDVETDIGHGQSPQSIAIIIL